MMVELHRTVSSLIEYLKHKWAFHDERIVSAHLVPLHGQEGLNPGY